MSIFPEKTEDVVVASPMEGRITFNGNPVAGAKMERWLKWKDERGEVETTVTDGSGEFHFNAKQDSVKLSPLTEFVIGQEIRVYHEGTEYMIWYKAKVNTDMYGELGGRPTNLRCELTAEPVRVEAGEGLLGTSCVWDSIEPQGERS